MCFPLFKKLYGATLNLSEALEAFDDFAFMYCYESRKSKAINLMNIQEDKRIQIIKGTAVA